MIEPDKKPLINWLLERYPDTPKTRAKQWIVAGRVRAGGSVVRKPHELMADPGETLQLLDRRATNLSCGAGYVIHPRVTLLHLDASLAVVNKGPGLISVPAAQVAISALSILADFLAGRLQPRGGPLRTLPPAYRKLQPLPVHRLDQFTTGVFCMAMNPLARQRLIEQLAAGGIRREYIAFVEGRLSQPQGTWRDWVALRDGDMRQHIVSERQASSAGLTAQEAITHYEVLTEYPVGGGRTYISKLRVRLETGRKHQIRAQAAHAGCPLIGDRTYHPKYQKQRQEDVPVPLSRQALHAETISLEHPDRPGQRMTWKAELPNDLRDLEELLRRGPGTV